MGITHASSASTSADVDGNRALRIIRCRREQQ
jgi:hypothetical protein